MTTAQVEEALRSVESQLEAVSATLLSGDTQTLTDSSSALRQATIDFSQLLHGLNAAERADLKLKQRLKKIATEMAARRESLIRHGVLAERALNAIVPATRGTTYAPAAAPYASLGRQTGAFKYLAA